MFDFFAPKQSRRTRVEDLRRAWAVSDAVKTLSRLAENPYTKTEVRIEAIRKLAEIARSGRRDVT